jgi:hypothetical protein
VLSWSTMVTPQQLSFGALAAERDISEGLKQYFVESESFRLFLEGKKYVALGNRGSGKSAIFKMLAERERARGSIVIELAPDDYSYEIFAQVLATEAQGSWAKQGAYAAAWKFLIYVLAMKALTQQGNKIKTGSAARIYEYLRDNHKNIEKNPIGTLISYIKRIEGVKVGKYEASLKTKELESLYRLEEINSLVPALVEISRSRNIVILVDELDKGWDGSEDAKSFVAGLFRAALAINQISPSVRVLLALRKELYESIPALYDDAQKVRDFIEIIEWDEPELLELISRRIAHSVPDLGELSAEDRWGCIFSKTLDYRGVKSFNYMIDRTLYRPREVISFCSGVREILLKTGLPASYHAISEAEHAYSSERVKDIAAEYRFQYPGMISVFETFRGMPYNFDRDDLEMHCIKLATGEIRVEAKWVDGQSPDVIIDALWRVGFLRAQAVGGIKARRRSGSTYLGPHQIESLYLPNIQRFHVHPMFRAHLGMREAKRSSQDLGDE